MGSLFLILFFFGGGGGGGLFVFFTYNQAKMFNISTKFVHPGAFHFGGNEPVSHFSIL